MVLAPTGSVLVEMAATPLVRVAVPRVVLPVTKVTTPVADAGDAVAVRVTLWPRVICVDEGWSVSVVVVRAAAHAMARLLKSTEPRPVTRL
jgi:hypothetical protein